VIHLICLFEQGCTWLKPIRSGKRVCPGCWILVRSWPVSMIWYKYSVHLKVRDTKPGSFETARITCSTLSRRVDRAQDMEDCICEGQWGQLLKRCGGIFLQGIWVVRDWFRMWGYHLCHGLDMIYTWVNGYLLGIRGATINSTNTRVFCSDSFIFLDYYLTFETLLK